MDIETALARVPDYDRFFTLDVMFAKARSVARDFPELASYQVVGTSTDGEPIPMVRIGNGDKRFLLFASPHPNEPIGAMLVQFLLDELIQNEPLRAGRSWFLLPCVDPDGTRLNEGWFGGPYTIRNYARHFYRPRSEEQVEWTFPIRYKGLVFERPLPETRALMRAFELARPHFVYSLHNAGFGGVYYYLSHDLKDVYGELHAIPTRRQLALSLGEPEVPWAVAFAPAIYRMPSVRDHYDYLETYGSVPAETVIQGGASSYDYLSERGKPVMLITELPYFQSRQISDTTPTDRSRREVILAGIDQTHEMIEALKGVLTRVAPKMTVNSRFYRSVVSFVDLMESGLQSKRAWAERAEGMEVAATVAQEVDELLIGSFYRLLVASMLRRALEVQQEVTPNEMLKAAGEELDELLEAWAVKIETGLEYEAIPIKKLVEVQYGALLALLNSSAFSQALTSAYR